MNGQKTIKQIALTGGNHIEPKGEKLCVKFSDSGHLTNAIK